MYVLTSIHIIGIYLALKLSFKGQDIFQDIFEIARL